MFGIKWDFFSQELRGILLMFFGVILLLHTLNILEKWLDGILIFFAVVMIVYGFALARVAQQISAFIKKEENKQSKDN